MVSSNVLSLTSSGFGPVSMLYHWASESSLMSEAARLPHKRPFMLIESSE